MFDVSAALSECVKHGGLNADDRLFYAMEKPSSAGGILGGAIGAAVAQSAAAKYLGSFNETGMAFCQVENDGSLVNNRFGFTFSNLAEIKVGGVWSNYLISVKYNDGQLFQFIIPPNIKGHSQQNENFKFIREYLKNLGKSKKG